MALNPNNSGDDRRLQETNELLNRWRSDDKPASGAQARVEPQMPRKPKPAGSETDKAENKGKSTSVNKEPSPAADKKPRSQSQNREVSFEFTPLLKTVMLAALSVIALVIMIFGLVRLFNRLNTANPVNYSEPTGEPVVIAQPTSMPENETAKADAETGASLESVGEVVFKTSQATVRTGTYEGTSAHIIEFVTDDGNIFIPELNRTFTVVNGSAVIPVSDAEWFESNPANDAHVEIALHPVLTRLNGSVSALETIEFEADVPASPLEIIQPENGYEEVLISLYSLQMKVLPGSTVTVNGNDMSDFIDRRGYLSVNQTVEAIGDNIVNIIVSTPSHKQTKARIILYRPIFDIPLELDINTIDSTSTAKVTISGTYEPGATLTITPQAVASNIDDVNGTFRFDLNLARIGDNVITITASKPGKESSTINHTIYYLPTEAEYSAKAWKMDYSALLNYYEVWQGRIFLCRGTVKEVYPQATADPVTGEGASENQALLLDVGTDREQLVYIDNYSAATAVLGQKYKMFADVDGLKNGYPHLIARYIYED